MSNTHGQMISDSIGCRKHSSYLSVIKLMLWRLYKMKEGSGVLLHYSNYWPLRVISIYVDNVDCGNRVHCPDLLDPLAFFIGKVSHTKILHIWSCLWMREGFTKKNTEWWFAKPPSTPPLPGLVFLRIKKMTHNFLFWEWTIDGRNKFYTWFHQEYFHLLVLH